MRITCGPLLSITLMLLGASLLSGEALAQRQRPCDKDKQQEQARLKEELGKLVGARKSGANYAGANRTFLQIQALGCGLDADIWSNGAAASQALGDAAAWLARLEGAKAAGAKQPEVEQGIKEIKENFGGVEIKVAGKASRDLVAATPPFNPGHGKCIDFAKAALTAQGEFEGLLPLGDYTIGGTSFKVVAGEKAKVKVKGK